MRIHASESSSRMEAGVEGEEPPPPRHSLHLRVNDRPSWLATVLFGCQASQSTTCLSGLLVMPFLISELTCAGDATVALRAQLIAATLVATGIATLLQTTLGLRLCILNGPAFTFIPPLVAFSSQPENKCRAGPGDHVPVEEWHGRLQTISGSLFLACLVFIVIGCTGLVGAFSKRVGPITTVPLMLLLTISIVPTMEQKLSLHWISIVMLFILVLFAIYLEDVAIPLPRLSRPLSFARVRIFGQLPYLLSIAVVWLLCLLLTLSGLEPVEGEARTDKAVALGVIHSSPWFQIPYPGQFGFPRVELSLVLGFMASAVSSVIENLGAYSIAARVSEQRRPPRSTVNRAIIVEGLGSMVAALLGIGAGVTTYTENVALIHITRVASRITMQTAGCLLIAIGLLTKAAAVFASIPDPLVGGILVMGMGCIAGVAMAQLKLVDLSLSRNLSILGVSLLLGILIPIHIERVPMVTGIASLDSTLNMLLTIRMLVGGLIAFFLDISVPGGTREQRGFHEDDNDIEYNSEDDGYSFPEWFNRFLRRSPAFSLLPFLPSQGNLAAFASQKSNGVV